GRAARTVLPGAGAGLPDRDHGGHRGGRRRMIIAGTVGLLVLAALAAAALPAVLRQLGPRGSGLIWVAGVAGPPAEAVPLGVLDDTAVIDARDRLLFLDLADGSLVGTVPLDPREDRPVLVPTGVLVRSAAGFQLYDRTGRARWPAPVEAQQALAHAGGVTVLTSCWGRQLRARRLRLRRHPDLAVRGRLQRDPSPAARHRDDRAAQPGGGPDPQRPGRDAALDPAR